jgi:hypothetical protein
MQVRFAYTFFLLSILKILMKSCCFWLVRSYVTSLETKRVLSWIVAVMPHWDCTRTSALEPPKLCKGTLRDFIFYKSISVTETKSSLFFGHRILFLISDFVTLAVSSLTHDFSLLRFCFYPQVGNVRAGEGGHQS